MFFFLKWPPVAILDVQKSLLTISDQYHNIYFGCPKFTFDRISGHFISIRNFLKFLTKWLPSPILDVRNSLSIAFMAVLDKYGYFFGIFYKMAAGTHFGCPKFTFDRISGHFRSIRNFIFIGNF